MVGQLADKVTLELEARTQAYRANISSARAHFNREVDAMARGAEKSEQRITAAGNKMSMNLGRAISAIAVAGAIKNAQELADTWTAAGNKLAAAGIPMAELAATQNQLADTARATRSEFDSTANTFARITRATEELNASRAQQLRVTELINKATKAGGATTQEQISTITQLTQAIASGNLQGDELRSIRENSPLLARAIAKEFGVTVGQLKALGKEGKLTADRVFKAILDYGPAIDAQFAKTRSTIGESFTALQTEAGRFLSQFDQANGVTQGISGFINKVADDFDLLAQAVIVSAAIIGGTLTGRFVQSLSQASVVQKGFVADIMAGKVALDLESEATRKNARETLLKAQADRDAMRAQVVQTQSRIAALREEANAYRTNMALAEAQRSVANQQANSGRTATGQFASRDDGTAARNAATKALIANRLQLSRVTKELAVSEGQLALQHVALGNQLGRVNQASVAMRSALTGVTLATQAASIASAGLSAALGFFGGPIGVAIIAVGAAMAYLSTEAAKAEAAAGNAEAILANLQQQAENTSPEIAALADKQIDQASASISATRESNETAKAYDTLGNAARNAAENVKYLTAQQRLAELEKVRTARRELEQAEAGSNPFLTNGQEALNNARNKLILKGTGTKVLGGFGGEDELLTKALKSADAKGATADLVAAAQEYRNQVKLRGEAAKSITELKAAEAVIFKSIDDPTQPKPPPSTGNLRPSTAAGSGSGSGSPRGSKGRSSEDLQAARDELEIQNRINIAQAQGADELATFLQDRLEYLRQVKTLLSNDPALSREEAEAQAAAYIVQLAAARDIGKENEDRAKAEKQAADDRRDEAERLKDLNERNAFLADQEVQLQLELARIAGDSKRVEELERILGLRQRISEYERQGGLTPEEATRRGSADQAAVDQATELSKLKEPVKELFRDGVRAALDGDLGEFFSNWVKDGAARGLENALNNLTDALFDLLKGINIGSGGGASDQGGILTEVFKSFFGGARAGGGQMQAGKWYRTGENGPEDIYVGQTAKAYPNSTLRASQGGGGGGGGNVQIVNNLGTAAEPKVERGANGDMKITLEPIFEAGIAGAGRSGKLRKALSASPRPVRRM